MTNEEIETYSNLVYSITHYFDNYKDKEDLYQAGIEGLLEAYQNFDSSYNTKFSTYAYPYILGNMKKCIRENRGIKISRSISSINKKIEYAKEILSQKLNKEPTTRELASFLDISENDIIEALKTVNIMQSLDEVISDEGKEMTLHEIISDNSIDLDTLIAFKEELNKLTDFERDILTKRYLYDMSQSEVASDLNLTQVKISREEAKIKKKIKSNMIV